MQGGQHYAKYFLFEVTHMGILAKAFSQLIYHQSPSPAGNSAAHQAIEPRQDAPLEHHSPPVTQAEPQEEAVNNDWTEASLKALKNDELKAILQGLGLKRSGNKKELVDRILGREVVTENKEKPKWRNSKARAMLVRMLMDKQSNVHKMTWKEIHASHEWFQEYDPMLFHDMRAFWDTHPAKLLLRGDVKAGKHLDMKPALLHQTRSEYKAFSLKTFRAHVYQEKRHQKELPMRDNEDDESVEVWEEFCHDDVSEDGDEEDQIMSPKKAFLVKVNQKADADGPWGDEADAQAAADTQIITVVIWDTSNIQNGPEVYEPAGMEEEDMTDDLQVILVKHDQMFYRVVLANDDGTDDDDDGLDLRVRTNLDALLDENAPTTPSSRARDAINAVSAVVSGAVSSAYAPSPPAAALLPIATVERERGGAVRTQIALQFQIMPTTSQRLSSSLHYFMCKSFVFGESDGD
ncbi:hypothetical protein QTG54_015575 [Skeletonema marinoi]|uniref:SAP domain-containing protein n=1 Tax=Skeletonema marinoi TaxID=267567 RepID=A0AAD8XUN4_9STRA|nr:hypothetical protein QTG54_015575 [Skeletonema marinoi]